jgi:ribosome-associated protein
LATRKGVTIKASHHTGGRGRPQPKKRTKRVLPPPAAHAEPAAPAPVRKARLEHVPTESVASDEARMLAIAISAAALEKKAVGLEILDVAGRTDYADFLVLMSGRSDRQVAALADGIEEAMRKNGRRAQNVEGRQNARWILLDFGDVIVHVFLEEVRSMYDLEGLWEDARRVPVPA